MKMPHSIVTCLPALGAALLALSATPAAPSSSRPPSAPLPRSQEVSEEARALLERLDRDADGRLATEELPELGRALALRFDADANGSIEGAELDALAAAMSQVREQAQRKSREAIAARMKPRYEADPASGLFLEAARDYHVATAGEALLVLRAGETIFEAYDHGYEAALPHLLASGTKSFTGILAALAVQEGLIEWDELVSATISEWAEDERRSIRVRDLLSLCSGLPPEQTALQSPGIKDKYAYAAGLKCECAPRSRFVYGPSPYFAFGEFMRRKFEASEELRGLDLQRWFRQRIGDPLGMKMIWRTDRAGHPLLAYGCLLRGPDWARFGEFVRLGGVVGEQRLLRRELLDECLRPSDCNPAYGLTWWRLVGEAEQTRRPPRDPRGLEAERAPAWMPGDLVFAGGLGGQRLFVSRERELTVVRFASDPGEFEEIDFFSWMLRGRGVERAVEPR